MIEEIKKEILNTRTFRINEPHIIDLNELFKILDKYNNQDVYKKMWEELPKLFIGTSHLGKLQTCMQELEQKYLKDGE